MDKLQPIIRHHFWILFVVALILPPIAWSMTSGALNEQTQARIDDLDKTLNGVSQGAGAPNGDWTTAATQLVNVRKESNRRAWSRLWDVQEQLQIWPGTVRPYMATCPYRGTPADVPGIAPSDAARVMAAVPNLFRADYEREIERVWRLPEPIDEQQGLKAEADALQKVLFPSTVMPRVPRAKWAAAQPTWKEMWNAQEDLWLMSELLKAIKRTNADATSIADANVRQIRVIQLFGGDRADASSSGSSGSSGGSDATSNPYSGMPGLGRPAAASGGPASANFPLAEEYTVKDAPSGGGGGGGGYSAAMMSGSMGNGAEPSGGGSGSGSGSDPQADENRYIKQEWAYRTRGFKLQLTVHQMYVPSLISELLKSQYPIEVVRFQQSAMNPDRPGANGAGGGYPGNGFAAAGGGFPGAGGYPGAGAPGSDVAFPGGSESLLGSADGNIDGTESLGSEGADYNPYGDVAGSTSGAAAAGNAVNSAVVGAALADVNLMDVVIVGEIYLYNKPEAAEAGDGTEAPADQAGGTAIPADPSVSNPAAAVPPVTGTPDAALNPVVAQPGVNAAPGSPAALTGEVVPPDGNAPATLGTTVIPAEGPTDGPPAAAPAPGSPPAGTEPPSGNAVPNDATPGNAVPPVETQSPPTTPPAAPQQ